MSALGEQNFFSFFFDAVNPFSDEKRITYYDQEGNYEFNQVASACTTATGSCTSSFPIQGFNLVPLPATHALFAIALTGLLAVRGRRRGRA